MSNYSLKERLIAKSLSKLPGIKAVLKDIYVRFNAITHKAPYKSWINLELVSELSPVVDPKDGQESFFGYYDKYPMNNSGWVLSHLSKGDTKSDTVSGERLEIILVNIFSKEVINIGSSLAYTWQQGTRAQWIDDDWVIYNDYHVESDRFIANIYSLSKRSIVKTIFCPVQDSSSKGFYLSLNYKRLMATTKDYGYKVGKDLDKEELLNIENDGIILINYNNEEQKILHSLKDIADLQNLKYSDSTVHTVNHIMLNDSGSSFIFIHRYYDKGIRYDRLIYSDFDKLSVLVDENMVSHCAWLDDSNIVGYLRYNNIDAYYQINTSTFEIKAIDGMNDNKVGDGHPSANKNFIVFDSYPDKSRLQSIFLFNKSKNTCDKLASFYQSIEFKGPSRCDLHPRFSSKDKIIFFDSVFNGARNQYYIKIK
ncbi:MULTISPECIES: hypothetical protein [Sphingobacterium]|uniref:hypothetical protein n=1 Tax=Sphingobacterium TaxID=28453 RepID=UPI00257E3467|nr:MULTISPECIES: hypothetical protein [Sphingobacterium]